MPDLILLDGTLPIVGGVEICRIVRARYATRFTAILFVTANDSPENRFAATQAGADAFIAKPFQTADLLDRVRALLASRRHLGELRPTGL